MVCEACIEARPCADHAFELVRRIWRMVARLPRYAATAAEMASTISDEISCLDAAGAAGGTARAAATRASSFSMRWRSSVISFFSVVTVLNAMFCCLGVLERDQSMLLGGPQ